MDLYDNTLEASIGREVRYLREKLGLNTLELANLSGVSVGMISKIENGKISPSLSTLQALGDPLDIPVTSFFRKYEEKRDISMVGNGEGLIIERRGSREGHQYRLLGHCVGENISVEPYLIELTKVSDVFPCFQHKGTEFNYVLSGDMIYRHGKNLYRMGPGDSLFFDAEAPHGPEEIVNLPVRMISVIVHSQI